MVGLLGFRCQDEQVRRLHRQRGRDSLVNEEQITSSSAVRRSRALVDALMKDSRVDAVVLQAFRENIYDEIVLAMVKREGILSILHFLAFKNENVRRVERIAFQHAEVSQGMNAFLKEPLKLDYPRTGCHQTDDKVLVHVIHFRHYLCKCIFS